MVIKRIHPNQRLAEAVVHGNTAYLAGQVPQTLGADIETQTREVLTTIDYALAQCGTDKSKLLTASIFLTDLADYDGMNKVWDEWVPEGCAPARATVQARLANPGWRVEIQAIAAL